MPKILSIDQSTSATKAAVFDEQGRLVCEAALPHKQNYPRPGWVEHDANEIYANTVKACKAVLEQLENSEIDEIEAIGISNQRETVLLWDSDGKPVGNAIVWQDSRAQEQCNHLSRDASVYVHKQTGLRLSALFSAAKVTWLLKEYGLSSAARQGRIRMGTIDSWLLYKLTGVHLTDITNASRTQLMSLSRLCWDEESAKIFGIPITMLPQIRSSDSVFGYTDLEGFLPKHVPVCAVMGDSHAAMFAQGCNSIGTAKVTYGTGSSIALNTGTTLVEADRLSTTVAWSGLGKVFYALEGNISHAADTITWLRNLGLLHSDAQSASMALGLSSNAGVYIVPAFTGLGAPWWSSEARALICGITKDTEAAHIVRAALEAIAYQVSDILDSMADATEMRPIKLMADGGPTGNEFLMQFQADLSDVIVDVAHGGNLSLRGAAYMAGLQCGIYDGLDRIVGFRVSERVYMRNANTSDIKKWKSGWHEAVSRTIYKP